MLHRILREERLPAGLMPILYADGRGIILALNFLKFSKIIKLPRSKLRGIKPREINL